jgi:WhiB family redox-sensing transcriptional regulator
VVAIPTRPGWFDDDPIAELVASIPPWHRDAVCQEHPEVDWFPEQGVDLAPARAVCARCLVRVECVAFALETGERHGIWGGTSARQRRHAIRERWDAERLIYEIATRAGAA